MRRSMVVVVVLAVTFIAPAQAAVDCTITGTSGADTLVGTPGNDVICGKWGNDILVGLAGDDMLRGGPGDDTLMGDLATVAPRQYGADTLLGGPGNDLLVDLLDPSVDAFDGGDGTDACTGTLADTFLNCEAVTVIS